MTADAAVLSANSARWWDRAQDYLELAKPRIAVLVLFTVAAGGVIAGASASDAGLIAHAVLGTALVACGASILNQVAERRTDALMKRTSGRPVPTGRVSPAEGRWVGYGSAAFGTLYLAGLVDVLASGIALVSFALYVFVYTPLKPLTPLNTVVGAIPGALPPLVGWAAVTRDLSFMERWGTFQSEAIWLFLLIFFWQFPHFFAIAWIYKDDYRSAGLQMLPTTRMGRRMTGWQMVSFCLILLPITIAPVMTGSASMALLVGALILGLQFLGFSVAFLMEPSRARAKLVLWSSLFHLPMMLCLWMVDVARGGW